MSLVSRGLIAFTFEHMPQMPTTFTANNLRPGHAKCAVRVASHSSWNGIEEGRPSAAGLEFVVGFVERRITGGAIVGSFSWQVFIVFPGEWSFGTLFADYAELF